MSLKDRLNSTTTPIAQNAALKPIEADEPKYYESDMIAKQINLGVIDEILIDDEIDSIYVNGAKNITVEKRGATHKSLKNFRDNVQLLNLIKKNAKDSGLEFDEKNPIISFNHKEGVNVVATLPPLSSNVCVAVKNYKDKFSNLQLMQEQGIISKETALVLEVISGLKNNILIAGTNNSLKTTFLSALAKKAPEQNAKNILVDYNSELKLDLETYSNFDFSNAKGENYILDKLIAINPDRLIVNSKDNRETNHLIQKILDGYRGLITTVTANSKQGALDKLIYNLLKENQALGYDKAKSIIYGAFDFIIFTENDKEGRKLKSLSQIHDNKIEDIFYLNQFREYVSNGIVPEFFEQTRLATPINANIFERSYKHTQNKTSYEPKDSLKAPNPEFLKKFSKKEVVLFKDGLSLEEFMLNEELKSEDDFEKLAQGPEDLEKQKRARQKLEELKMNIKSQDSSFLDED